MKRYRCPWHLSAFTLLISCLIFLASTIEIPAMGQPAFHTATPSQSDLNEAGTKDFTSRTAQPRTATGSAASYPEVVKVIDAISDFVIEAECSRAKEMVSQALSADPVYQSAVVKLSDGSRKIFPIQYDYEFLDHTQVGLTALPGTIVPPKGYHISPELAETEIPIFLYDPDDPCEIPVASAEPLSHAQFILPEHAVLEDLLKKGGLDREIYYILEGGLTWSKPLSWDFDNIDFGTPGTYQAYARPILPDGILLPDGLPELTCDIVIQEDDAFLLGPPEFTGLYMISQWTKETPDPNRFRCFYAIGQGEWQEDIGQDLISIPDFAPQYLQIFYYEDVFFDTPYYFRLSYDGEYSNVLKVYFSEGQIHYRLYDGDRDGGDREDQTVPDISQTVPPSTDSVKPEETPSFVHPSEDGFEGFANRGSSTGHKDLSAQDDVASGPGFETQAASSLTVGLAKEDASAAPTAKAASDAADSGQTEFSDDSLAVLEEDAADYAVYSGRRLQKYMELNPGRPFFITKHQIQLEIPMENSVFSQLEDRSLLRVDILPLSGGTIRVELFIDGVPVPSDKIPELTITMAYPTAEKNIPLQVTDSAGVVLAAARVEDSFHITFTVNQTGTFRIQAVPIPSAASPSDAENTSFEGVRGNGLLTGNFKEAEPTEQNSAKREHSPLAPAVLTALCIFVPSVLWYVRHFRRTG